MRSRLFFILCFLILPSGADAGLCGDGYRRLARAPRAVAGQIRDLLRTVNDGVRFYSGRATRDLDSRSFALFDRVRTNPTAEILPEELEHLREQGALSLFEQYRDSARIVREFNHARGLLARSAPGTIERSFIPRWGDRLRSFFLPLIPDVRAGRVRGVYERFLNEENLRLIDLSPDELQLIERAGLRTDLDRFIADLADYRSGFAMLTRVRSNARVLGWTAVAGASLGVGVLNQMGVQDISVEASVDPRNPVGMNPDVMQTELIFTRCPEFPVMIRRRATIFGLNLRGMSSETTALDGRAQPLYLRTILAMPCFREGHIRVSLNLENEDAHREVYRHLFDRSLTRNLHDLARLPGERAVQELEQVVGGLVPPLIDMNEDTILAFLAARRALGDTRIGGIYRASPAPRSSGRIAFESVEDVLNAALVINLYRVLILGEILFSAVPNPCLAGCPP